MNKLVKLCIVCVIVGVTFLCVWPLLSGNKNSEITKIEYKTDAAPIIKRFPVFSKITTVYWKAASFGRGAIGPSDVWFKGFVVLDEVTFKKLLSQYEWSSAAIDFQKGMEPSITGYNNYDWFLNKTFSKELKGNTYMGEFYLDKVNGIIYFDLTTH